MTDRIAEPSAPLPPFIHDCEPFACSASNAAAFPPITSTACTACPGTTVHSSARGSPTLSIDASGCTSTTVNDSGSSEYTTPRRVVALLSVSITSCPSKPFKCAGFKLFKLFRVPHWPTSPGDPGARFSAPYCVSSRRASSQSVFLLPIIPCVSDARSSPKLGTLTVHDSTPRKSIRVRRAYDG